MVRLKGRIARLNNINTRLTKLYDKRKTNLLGSVFETMRTYKNVEAEISARLHAFCIYRELQRKKIALEYLIGKLHGSMQQSKVLITREHARD